MTQPTKDSVSAYFVLVASASLVNPMAQGAATNWITKMVAIRAVVVKPNTVIPYMPARAVTELIPSIKKKYASM